VNKRAQESIEIMDRARQICAAHGGGIYPRSVLWIDQKPGLLLQVPKQQSNAGRVPYDSLRSLTAIIQSEMPELDSIMSSMGEKLVDTHIEPLFPSPEQEARAAQLFNRSEEICNAHEGGVRVNCVLTVEQGYVVDINVYPLDGNQNKKVIVRAIEDEIKSLPDVFGLAYFSGGI